MAAPIDLRNDFDSVSLRRLAKRTRDATQSRRLLALAEVYDGGSRTDASRSRSADHSRLGAAFNARGPDGLVDGKSPGAPSKLNADHRRDWRRLLRPARSRRSTASCAGGARTWRGGGDVRHLARRDGRARVEGARLRQDLGAAAPLRAKRAGRRGFSSEDQAPERRHRAVVAQKNKNDGNRMGLYLHCRRGKAPGWALVDTDVAAHLIEISAAVDPGAHAVLIVDQAGWHAQDNITVLALPPRAIHARQLVVEPDLQILRRHRRAVLPSRRPTMGSLHAQMGAWVLINDRWYKRMP